MKEIRKFHIVDEGNRYYWDGSRWNMDRLQAEIYKSIDDLPITIDDPDHDGQECRIETFSDGDPIDIRYYNEEQDDEDARAVVRCEIEYDYSSESTDVYDDDCDDDE